MSDGPAGTKTGKGGGNRLGQQDGADRLGPDDERYQLQDSDGLTKHSAVCEANRVGEVLMV